MTSDDIHAALAALPEGDEAAAAAVAARQDLLTKPPGSLGRLETIVAWLARWQRHGLTGSRSWSSRATMASPRTASRLIPPR